MISWFCYVDSNFNTISWFLIPFWFKTLLLLITTYCKLLRTLWSSLLIWIWQKQFLKPQRFCTCDGLCFLRRIGFPPDCLKLVNSIPATSSSVSWCKAWSYYTSFSLRNIRHVRLIGHFKWFTCAMYATPVRAVFYWNDWPKFFTFLLFFFTVNTLNLIVN